MSSLFEFGTNMLASASEQGRGIRAVGDGRQPAELLRLYDMEGCPYCRRVREVLTELDLDAEIYPCPKGGRRYRELVARIGGKEQFPFLEDPNTDELLYESDDIIEYLYSTYGNRRSPAGALGRVLNTAGSFAASAFRAGRGLRARNSNPPIELLELYSFEASPFARRVRELLTEMEIPYILRQSGRTQAMDWVLPPLRARVAPDYRPEQRNRLALLERAGKVAIPYLVDPNSGDELFESQAIMDYLLAQYGA